MVASIINMRINFARIRGRKRGGGKKGDPGRFGTDFEERRGRKGLEEGRMYEGGEGGFGRGGGVWKREDG